MTLVGAGPICWTEDQGIPGQGMIEEISNMIAKNQYNIRPLTGNGILQ
jgi:hypothetical protein